MRSKRRLVADDAQADSYFELLNPRRAALLKKSVDLSRHILPLYPDVSFEELAVEISVRMRLIESNSTPPSCLLMGMPDD